MSKAAVARTRPPLISEKYLDVPAQRLYYLSLGALLQAGKLYDFARYQFAVSDDEVSHHYGLKWLVLDAAFILGLALLRIPRLQYSKALLTLFVLISGFLNGFLFGGITLNLTSSEGSPFNLFSLPWRESLRNRQSLPSTPEAFSLTGLLLSPLAIFNSRDANGDRHLLGEHTIRMSPISTARLNPDDTPFCLSPPKNHVLVPILLNNTNAVSLRYSLTPLGYVEGQAGTGSVEYIDVGARELKAVETARLAALQQLIRPSSSVSSSSSSSSGADEWEDEDDEDDEDESSNGGVKSNLQKTQSVAHIRLSKPGTIRLERVLDASGVEARVAYPTQLTVVPCPTANFAPNNAGADKKAAPVQEEEIRCAGDDRDLELSIQIAGVPPLSLRWYKEVNGKIERSLVEGIETAEHGSGSSGDRKTKKRDVFERLDVPLTVPLDVVGRHTYVLETVMDAYGNLVNVGGSLSMDSAPASSANSHSVRTLQVLRRPAVSFKQCGPGRPASLLVGKETPLFVSTTGTDGKDAPWDVEVQYQPFAQDDEAKSGKQGHKPWKNTVHAQKGNQDVQVTANAPGEYTIVGIKGKYCSGDVLEPQTCKVVEKPLPAAEIDWKRIHECSGDTGVSASLVLHGTPPFTLHYRTQRNAEHPREVSKIFNSARGELLLQPEREGEYVYEFISISDANYKKVPLEHAPRVQQVVHPLATAEFRHAHSAGAGAKRSVNSCGGNVVDVEVDLRGTAPWTLEVQVVGAHSTETIKIRDITTSPAQVRVPIPKTIDKEGGTFDIELVSVEDSQGCKRSITVPGLAINVRRVLPSAKFYGTADKRQALVLENSKANLPLRLTGDGPWQIKYRRTDDPDTVLTETLRSPNAELQVTKNGLYEILEITDSQCPGTVIVDAATYQVNWISRPAAKLSSHTQSHYEAFNGSHILNPVCQGVNDHVDLDLTGRPPFQITYNIAEGDDMHGTRLLDQPTFNSIQPHTRFQLHTSAVGRKYYEVKQIGDAAYPLEQHRDVVIPRDDRLLFEQQVLARPSASFVNDKRMFYCLHDSFTPQSGASSGDGTIVFEGTAPFEVQLTIKSMGSSETRVETVTVPTKVWQINLPNFRFSSVGPHTITINDVKDASACEQAPAHLGRRRIWIVVAESAAIVPFDRREHYCVGDVSSFVLEGLAPWTIGYRINGKPVKQEAKTSPFSLVQSQPGEFAIESIAHQNKRCTASVTDLHFAVHALPSAQVGHGKRVYQDIHEGDQAEILFTLIGEPPFTFTYQRSEASTRKGGKPGKVLESHTISGVTTNEYSIFSSSEGTWTVTSIADKYCRYPPGQPDGTVDKSKL